MTTVLSPLPVQKFFSNNGRPLVGGLLFTYEAGTNNKIDTFTDSSGGSLNTNPVVLDYRGECRVWLDPALTYKFVLSPAGDTDPPTKPIWTEDNVAGGVTISVLTRQFLGQILWPRTQAEIDADITPSDYGFSPGDPRGSVFRYGAICDGSANDQAAVQRNLDVGGLVTFPPNGVVKCNTGLVMDAATTTLDGQGSALISGLSAAGALLQVNSSGGTEQCTRNALQRLYFGGSLVAGVAGILFQADAVLAGFTLDRVTVFAFVKGISGYSNCFGINYSGCTFTGCTDGMSVTVSTIGIEKLTFNYCFFANCTRAIFCSVGTCQIFLVNCSLDYCNKIIETSGTALFDNCYVENSLDTAYWFITGTTENSFIEYRGGQIVITGAKTAFTVAFADTGSQINFTNVLFFSSSDSVGGNFLGSGTGSVYARGCKIQGFVHNALAWAGGSSSQNLCNNGTFPVDLSGWTLAHSGGSADPSRDATGGSSGGPAMLFNASVVGTDTRASWTIPAEPGNVVGVAVGLKAENVTAKILFILQAKGQNDVVIASSDIIEGSNRFGSGVNVPNTNFNVWRNAFSRLPAGTTKVTLVIVSDYSGGFKWWAENVVICKY